MQTLSLLQGSEAWHQHRARARNASDAPAVLDCSPFTTRAKFLAVRHSGVRPEVDAAQQRRFDEGHAIEAEQLAGAEAVIGEALYPVIGVADVDGVTLSASFDGLTIGEDTVYECKTLNDDLRAVLVGDAWQEQNDGRRLPKCYRVQMEQQLAVCAGERVLFVAASRDGSDVRRCWYYPDLALRAEIVAAWRQFDADLASYVPSETVERVVAAPIEALPAVSVQVQGSLAVRSNLDVFGARLREFVARIPAKPSSDQEFADAEAAVKALKRAEEALDSAEMQAIAQASSIEELTRSVSDLRSVARTARLATEKLVKARKEQMRGEEVARGRSAIVAHVQKLNAGLGGDFVPVPAVDFGSVISGLKSIESIRNAIDTAVANGKIAVGDVAALVTSNQATARELLPADLQHLVPDLKVLLLKPADDCRAQIEARLAAHRAAEERRLEAERERIRREEAERLERQQAQQAAAPTPTPTPTQAPAATAAPAAVSPSVVPMPTRAPALQAKATLTVGAVCARIGPGCTLTREFITRTLGIAGTEGERAGAVLFSEQDVDLLCEAFKSHLTTVQAQLRRAA